MLLRVAVRLREDQHGGERGYSLLQGGARAGIA